MHPKPRSISKLQGSLILMALVSATLFNSRMCSAAVYLDGSATGCSDGSADYNPATRTCGSGSDKVYLNLETFGTGITAGATNFMREGSYFRDTGSRSTGALHIPAEKSGSTGNPTIVKAYPGEERKVLIGSATRGATYNSDPADATGAGSWNYYPNPSVVVYSATHVTLDGVKTFGQVYLAGGHDVTLQNSDCGGGGGNGTISSDQGNTVRLNNIYNATLRNNRIHHNCRRCEDNSGSLIIGYAFSALIDQNTFTDGYGTCFENKDGNGQTGRTTEIRYNFFDTSTISTIDLVGVRGFNQAMQTSHQYIHHNIFYRQAIGFHVIGSPAIENIAYNNTFIDCGSDFRQPSSGIDSGMFETYNNLLYHSDPGKIFFDLFSLSQLVASDWNMFCGTGSWIRKYATVATTIDGWQTLSSLDANSVSFEPAFENPTGDTPADFKRTSYAENFSGSTYSTYAGAYETGNEVIGCTFTSPSAMNGNPFPANPVPGKLGLTTKTRSNEITFVVKAPERGRLNLRVYDTQGRQVWQAKSDAAGQLSRTRWTAPTAGVYYTILEQGNSSVMQKAVVVR